MRVYAEAVDNNTLLHCMSEYEKTCIEKQKEMNSQEGKMQVEKEQSQAYTFSEAQTTIQNRLR